MKIHPVILEEVSAEYDRATELHGAFLSPHEGYAVLLEEMDELWTEIKKRNIEPELLHKEAIQVAAMALRFLNDVAP